MRLLIDVIWHQTLCTHHELLSYSCLLSVECISQSH